MFCTKCGAEIQMTATYCSQCGTPTGVRPADYRPIPEARLERSRYNRKIAGVCGGIGSYLNIDPTLIRLIWLVCTVSFPPLLLGYLAAWIVMPNEPPRIPAAEPLRA
jgi:phage shock protein C